MAIRPGKWLERKTRERAARQWTALAGGVETLPSARLRHLREEARALRGSLDRFLIGADRRAARSRAALDALLEGREVSPDQKPSLGCNIKWKSAS